MLEPVRHLSVFNPHAFGSRRVDVIGLGATGSEVAVTLAKLGVQNLHLWDFDTVADHNLANQYYGLGDVGVKKATALARHILLAADQKVNFHTESCKGEEGLGDVVFLLTDTMASRREIAQNLYYGMTSLVIETRIDADMAMIYAFNPCSPSQIAGWEATLYDDAQTMESACGSKTSVGPTAKLAASLAVWQMIHWFSAQEGRGDGPSNETIITLQPPMMRSREFDL